MANGRLMSAVRQKNDIRQKRAKGQSGKQKVKSEKQKGQSLFTMDQPTA